MTLGALVFLALSVSRKEVVITIDDLCFVGAATDFATVRANTELLLKPIAEQKIPAIGFVVGSSFDRYKPQERQALYDLWVKAGCQLGNHTWTHANYDEVSSQAYEAEIKRTDAQMRKALGRKHIDYFRAPYLNNGKDDAKKTELRRFLSSHRWTEAPVTIDTDDWKFADAYDKAFERGDRPTMDKLAAAYVPYIEARTAFFEKQAQNLFGRPMPQILLTHANRINARQMSELLAMFRRRGYSFVNLASALKDKAYATPDTYVGSWGLSWIYRWQLAKGQEIVKGPQPPDWLMD